MTPVWQADSEAALAGLRTGPLRHHWPKEFEALFGYLFYLLGNRGGLDAWHHIPAPSGAAAAAPRPPVSANSGALEKNLKVHRNGRFKRQGRSWHPVRAARLLPLHQLHASRPHGTPDGNPNPNFTSNPTRLDLPATDS